MHLLTFTLDLFVPLPKILGGEGHVFGLSIRPSVRSLSINTFFA